MALLSDADRAEVTAEIQRRGDTSFGGITKPELRAAVDAADQWTENNAASLNAFLPLPARTSLSAADKGLVYSHVITKRSSLL